VDGSEKLTLKTLREQVYDYLRESLNRRELLPGATVDLSMLSQKLGVSKTPLRFALSQLENEGFVTILPRRGCVVNVLTLEEIRNIYQIIGALESSVVLSEAGSLTPHTVERLRGFNQKARAALVEDDFDLYYAYNLDFHDTYLDLSSNEPLLRTVRLLKHRLYDFPRKGRFVKNWELRSTDEHEEFVRRLETGSFEDAAAWIRDVHWSYDVQRGFIEKYYMEPDTSFPSASEDSAVLPEMVLTKPSVPDPSR
jgi:DNA-binding GntR family transcriptional regulator